MSKPISIGRLFAEPFTPAWQVRQAQAETHKQLELNKQFDKSIEAAWRRRALESRMRIIQKFCVPVNGTDMNVGTKKRP